MNVVVIHELCNLESNNLILKLIIAHKSDYVKNIYKTSPNKEVFIGSWWRSRAYKKTLKILTMPCVRKFKNLRDVSFDLVYLATRLTLVWSRLHPQYGYLGNRLKVIIYKLFCQKHTVYYERVQNWLIFPFLNLFFTLIFFSAHKFLRIVHYFTFCMLEGKISSL